MAEAHTPLTAVVIRMVMAFMSFFHLCKQMGKYQDRKGRERYTGVQGGGRVGGGKGRFI